MCEAKGTYCIFAASGEPEVENYDVLESTETTKKFSSAARWKNLKLPGTCAVQVINGGLGAEREVAGPQNEFHEHVTAQPLGSRRAPESLVSEGSLTFSFSRRPNLLLSIFWASSIMDVSAFSRLLSEIEDKFPRLRPASDASRLIC
jgi:hypothetical protein